MKQYTFPLIVSIQAGEYTEESLSFPNNDIELYQMSYASFSVLPIRFLFNIFIGADSDALFSQSVHSYAFAFNMPFRFVRPLRISKGKQMIVRLQSLETVTTGTIPFVFDGVIL